MLPYVGPAGTGVSMNAKYGADVVILEPGGKDIRRTEAQRICDQGDRGVIMLPERVGFAGEVGPCVRVRRASPQRVPHQFEIG